MEDASYLLDTNILLRLLQPRDLEYTLVRRALETLRSGGAQLCFAPQNLAEFWNVCTRPAEQNGFGLSVPETDRRAQLIESAFRLLVDTEHIHVEWRRLVVVHGVAGAQVHDARLVATMIVHGVSNLLTLNERDFARYQEVNVVHPRQVLAAI